MDLSLLQPGSVLFTLQLPVSLGAVQAYVEAVADGNGVYFEEQVAPPMAVAALVMARALEAIDLPPGTVHTGQELSFTAPVALGIEMTCQATVAHNSVRRGTRFMAIEFTGDTAQGIAVSGKVSLAVPEQEG